MSWTRASPGDLHAPYQVPQNYPRLAVPGVTTGPGVSSAGHRDIRKFRGKVLAINNWHRKLDSKKLKLMRRFVEEYGNTPELREFTINEVLRPAGVLHDSRDHAKIAATLLSFVQTCITYMNEPGEQLQSPFHTLKVRHGDCFAEGTLVLRDDYELIPIEQVQEGDRIWGRNDWSTVEAWAEKGTLPVTIITLNNGSTMRLTEDHKVYVKSCELHGPHCPDLMGSASSCKKAGREFTDVRIRVSELLPGMEVITPERIAFGREAQPPDRAYIEGLYLADGWTSQEKGPGGTYSRFCISGLDGHAKEDQKLRVQHICEAFGVSTRWHRKYIAVNDAVWAQRLAAMGKRAWEKAAVSLDLDESAARSLLEGLMADSGANTNGSGRTYSSTSYTLMLQTRVLHKMFGQSCSTRRVDDHGGLGDHPIFRLGVRYPRPDGQREKRLRVKSIERNAYEAPCYDIQTSDHYVYLPEADCTVSNCDDMAILLGAMAQSIRLPWRFVLAGKLRDGRRIRWADDGRSRPPRGASFHHIYLDLGWPPFRPQTWKAAEPTIVGAPLGYDVVAHGLRDFKGRGGQQMPGTLPELAGPWGQEEQTTPQDAALDEDALLRQAWRQEGFVGVIKAIPWWELALGVFSSVLTAYVTQKALERAYARRR